MPTQGPNGPSTGGDDNTVGLTAWTNPGNVTTEDGTFATCTAGGLPTNSDYLTATRFGFSIPSDATVNGIQVEWKRKGSGPSAVTDASVKIIKGGTVSGTEKSASAAWNTVLQYDSFGGSSDLWGLTWTPADINGNFFGAAVSASIAGSNVASVDFCRITITYTPALDPSTGFPWPPQSIPPRMRQIREVVAY